jgi:hypothetical protein
MKPSSKIPFNQPEYPAYAGFLGENTLTGNTRMNKHLKQIEKHLNAIHKATREEVYDYEEFKDIMGDIMLRSALALTYLETLKEQDKRRNQNDS